MNKTIFTYFLAVLVVIAAITSVEILLSQPSPTPDATVCGEWLNLARCPHYIPYGPQEP